MYFRRNKVTKATKISWPGNDLQIFRGNSENTKKLDNLVAASCSSKFFTEACIRQHNIIDTVSERRKQVNKGYDYDKVRLACIILDNIACQLMF